MLDTNIETFSVQTFNIASQIYKSIVVRHHKTSFPPVNSLFTVVMSDTDINYGGDIEHNKHNDHYRYNSYIGGRVK